MIKIRLQRKGRIRRPIYHIVVADSRSPRDGRIIEQVGRHDGVTEKKETILNEDRIMYWLDSGAQPTDSVRKILRREGLLYKRHLMMWGKSEEEIEAAMAEWRAYRESKADNEVSRKEKVKAALAAEEKEFKKQVEQKAEKAAAEVAAEKTIEEEAEAAAEEQTEEASAEESSEETADEAEASDATAEEESEDAAPEAETEETEDTAAEEEATAETEAPAEEKADEKEDEPVAEEASDNDTDAEEDAPEEAVASESEEEEKAADTNDEDESGDDSPTSMDMTAKEAIDHINNTDLDALKGFVPEGEDRKTVLSAWESKQEG